MRDSRARRCGGAAVFKSLACSACHKIGGTGGDIGPDLTAIGTTLSAERIAEELLWPNRQVKEGFSVVQVITADGKIHQGYERKTKESQATGDLVIQDLATKQLVTIKRQDIDEKTADRQFDARRTDVGPAAAAIIGFAQLSVRTGTHQIGRQAGKGSPTA